uniref:Serpin B4-like n=2 Tax=Camelus TaxID=9836 RepID=A0A9W3EYB3_CAMBA|nr:serpin B4-like [Camelus bactrianus]XP_010959576.1 serpin B4-like [Camelus bactrianus]XP_045377414.1 serpin B4-like [Camelus bactrianus]XP_045377415.1 serpin B4-like [Camelus bactrianus]
MDSLSGPISHFAVDLYEQIRQRSRGKNIFYSPLSIMSAFGMLYLGSRGNTAAQLQKALHFKEVAENPTAGATADPAENPENHHFQNLLTELNKPTNSYELKVANRLYGRKEFPFLQEYMDNVKKLYLASVESADFANAPEESRKMINSWVERQTNGKIKDLFLNDSIDSSTILVLVNAIYFKGQWHRKFKEENTVEEKFWLSKDRSKSVQMMKETNDFNFTSLEDMQVKILEIPYKGEELSMMLLLPNEVDGLQKLEDKLTAEKLLEWTSSQNMWKSQVDLHLPRFKVEETYDLKDMLVALGVVDAFSSQDADLSGMTRKHRLAVSKALHKSFVEVNEEGTEAAAATGIVIRETAALHYERFHCDHAFLFFIRHNKTNSILFLGRVSSP